MDNLILISLYFVAACVGIHFTARNRTYVGINVPNVLRCILLIFLFEKIGISIFVVLSQIYLYFLLLLFIMVKTLPAEMNIPVVGNPDTLRLCLFLVHFAILSPIAIIESSICEWRYKRGK